MTIRLFLCALWLAVCGVGVASAQNTTVADELRSANEDLRAGNCRDAAGHLRRALAIDPNLIKVQALLGVCEHRMGDPAAQELLEKSVSKLADPKLKVQAGLELANSYQQNGEIDRAANLMQSLVDVDPDNVDLLFMTQQLHSELADDTLNKLAILAPKSARMQQAIAEHLINAGDLPHAIEHYRRALELDPRLPGARLELAEAMLQSAPSDASVQAEVEHQVEMAVQNDGDSANAECMLAKLELGKSDDAAADLHFTRALRLNAQSVEAQLGAARMSMAAGRPQDALQHLKVALNVDPLNSEAHYRMAAVYRKLGEADAAHRESKLFEEIKQTKSEVRDLYRQMNTQAPQQMQEFTGGDNPATTTR